MKRAIDPSIPQCSECGLSRADKACYSPPGRAPDFCPSTQCVGVVDAATLAYDEPETRTFAREASIQESTGYAERDADPWVKKPCKPRLQEVWEFAQRMGYRRLGLAFCLGLEAEAKIVGRLLRSKGFEVVSVACKVGAVPKARLGLDRCDQLRPAVEHESMCNPIAQAHVMNHSGTELNILLGLCVGHDSLFLKHADAPCTVLAVKDRVTGHNPLAALYTLGSYYERFGST